MPVGAQGRTRLNRSTVRTLVLLTLTVVLLALVVSFFYFRAGRRAPEGAEVVLGGLLPLPPLAVDLAPVAFRRRRGLGGTGRRTGEPGRRTGEPGLRTGEPGVRTGRDRQRAWACSVMADLRYLWGLQAEILGEQEQVRPDGSASGTARKSGRTTNVAGKGRRRYG